MNALLAALVLVAAPVQDKKVWTDPADPSLPADFKIQGEYAGDKVGAHVIALGGGQFHAVVYPGGLPGAGWDGTSKVLLAGGADNSKAVLAPAAGARKYLAQKPEEFSATRKFPPEGQKAWNATADGTSFVLTADDGKVVTLAKAARTSPTMGAAPPAGAVVLFDGKTTDEWKGGRLDAKTGLLNTDGADIVSNGSS